MTNIIEPGRTPALPHAVGEALQRTDELAAADRVVFVVGSASRSTQ